MQKQAKRIYLDHAATTPMRPEVIAVMNEALSKDFGNPSSFYQEGYHAADLLRDARKSIAEQIGAQASEIFFTSGGTEADNWAVRGAAHAYRKKGQHLITSKVEHPAVLHSFKALENEGFEVSYLDVDDTGYVHPDRLREALREDSTVVSIMMANNEVGTINPIQELGRICQEHRVVFHSDAVQALGAIPIDVQELNCDMLSFSSHKLYGPKGIGALYKRRGLRIAPLLYGGAQERMQRPGTENLPAILGFAKALELAVEEMSSERQRQMQLRDYLIKELPKHIPYTKLNGHPELRLPNNVNFSFEFIEGESILLLLNAQGYACSSGSACASSSLDASHVLIAMGLPYEIAHGSIRLSLGRSTTMADMDALIADLPLVIERLRELSPLWSDYKAGRIIESIIPE